MKKLVLLFLILIFAFAISTNFLFAAGGEDTSAGGQPVELTNPLTGTTKSEGIPTLLGKIINAVLGIVGSLALVMFIFGGITWMTAAGNAEKVSKGKNILIWAAIGLVVIFSSYALVKFIITSIGVK